MVITTEDRFTGGPDGMSVLPLRIGGLVLQGERIWYWIVGALPARSPCGWRINLIESPIGRALRALHSSEIAAEVVGIDSAPRTS